MSIFETLGRVAFLYAPMAAVIVFGVVVVMYYIDRLSKKFIARLIKNNPEFRKEIENLTKEEA